jgi:large subunit ribosomal protein L29
MASSKFQELKSFSSDDLLAELLTTEEQYGKLKFDHAVRGLDNPLILAEARKDIARLKTEIRRREIEAMSAEELANRSKIRERRR